MDLAHQEQVCNFGYPQGKCGHFPAGAAAHAAHFSVLQDEPREPLLRIIYVLEKDHVPVEHGTVACLKRGGFSPPIDDALLAAQANAFVASYRRREKSVVETA